MNRNYSFLPFVAASLLSLPACVQAPSASRASAGAGDISRLPPLYSATPAQASEPRQLMQPGSREQSELQARREATRGLRPGVNAGEREELQLQENSYELPRPALTEEKPLAPPAKPALPMPPDPAAK